MPSDWIILIIAIGTAALWVFAKPVIEQRFHERNHGREIAEPFSAEVIYRGTAIADLTDRVFIEMFWREYRIEPRTVEAKGIIEDDDLWDECVFDFRDPRTGNVCTSGFVGGTKPFIKDGRISLRGLYFGGKAATTKPEQGVTNACPPDSSSLHDRYNLNPKSKPRPRSGAGGLQAPQTMNQRKRLLVIIASASLLGIAFPLRKLGWESEFNRPWEVDIDASVNRIDDVPDRYKSRFRSLEGYRRFVKGRANGLRLALYKNGSAAMTGGWFGGTKARWKEDEDFDYWIHTGNVFVTGVGHGFDRTSARTARLKFQLEWDENVATREFLIMRRK